MYDFTQEQLDFRKNIREFVDKEVLPQAQRIDISSKFPYQIIPRSYPVSPLSRDNAFIYSRIGKPQDRAHKTGVYRRKTFCLCYQ